MRYAHFDIATKWLFIEARGVQSQMRFPQLENFLRDNRSFDSAGQAGKRIRTALKYLDGAFPSDAGQLRNRASVFSVCMLAATVVETGLPRSTAQQFGDFIDKFFAELTTEVEKGAKATDTELLRLELGTPPGRSLYGNLDVLVTTVTKNKNARLIASFIRPADRPTLVAIAILCTLRRGYALFFDPACYAPFFNRSPISKSSSCKATPFLRSCNVSI